MFLAKPTKKQMFGGNYLHALIEVVHMGSKMGKLASISLPSLGIGQVCASKRPANLTGCSKGRTLVMVLSA